MVRFWWSRHRTSTSNARLTEAAAEQGTATSGPAAATANTVTFDDIQGNHQLHYESERDLSNAKAPSRRRDEARKRSFQEERKREERQKQKIKKGKSKRQQQQQQPDLSAADGYGNPRRNHQFEYSDPTDASNKHYRANRYGSEEHPSSLVSEDFVPTSGSRHSSFASKASRASSTRKSRSQRAASGAAAGPSSSLGSAEPSSSATPQKQKQARKAPSRFSLRRLFYDNPLLAQPFLSSPLAPQPSGGGSRSRHVTGSMMGATASSSGPQPKRHNGLRHHPNAGNRPDGADTGSEKSVGWRDNISISSSLHGTTIPAPIMGPDGKLLRECPLCLLTVPVENFPLLLNCPHLFCLDCLKVYVKIELQEGRANLKCPQCVEPMHPNNIEYLIGDKSSHLLRLYESLMLRRLLATDPDTRWCPGPNCSYAVIATGCASCPKITCLRPGCGHSFCYHCKAEWHPNQTCDAARAQRDPSGNVGGVLGAAASSSFSGESLSTHGAGRNEVKLCPRCAVLIVKMDDGSCNHMTCAVCGSEFCWLCMKEISDLHYLSPSGCTFWGKKPWSRKKKLLWQLGTLVGAPVGIALLAGISVPAMIIGLPVWVGMKIFAHYNGSKSAKRTTLTALGVTGALIISPVLAALTVSIGVPILLAYVYGVVPISLCRSEGCGVTTSENGGVKIDVEEEPYRPAAADAISFSGYLDNPSIGAVSVSHASLSMGSACHMEDGRSCGEISAPAGSMFVLMNSENDSQVKDTASNTAIAGTSLTGSLASASYHVPSKRLEVGAEVHQQTANSVSSPSSFVVAPGAPQSTFNPVLMSSAVALGGNSLSSSAQQNSNSQSQIQRKKASYSSDLLSETVSLSERSTTVSLAEGNTDQASTKALAGSLLAYKLDTQSVASYRTNGTGGDPSDILPASGDEISLRSLPGTNNANHQSITSTVTSIVSNRTSSGIHTQRSLSPVSCVSGDELREGLAMRRSIRNRRPHLDKQLSENSSLLSGEDGTSERVRFDDTVSFILDDRANPQHSSTEEVVNGAQVLPGSAEGSTSNLVFPTKIHKPTKLDPPSGAGGILPEETAEELALVISPEPKPKKAFNLDHIPAESLDSRAEDENVTLLSIDGKETKGPAEDHDQHNKPCIDEDATVERMIGESQPTNNRIVITHRF